MSNTKQKNILDDVLYGVDADATDGQNKTLPQGMELLQGIIHRRGETPSALSKQEKPGKDKPPAYGSVLLECPKKRTTIYLTPATYEQLAASKALIRELLPEDASLRVSMSGIVDNALRILLKELDEKRNDSVLFKLMLRNSE